MHVCFGNFGIGKSEKIIYDKDGQSIPLELET
jgi:hypothetical protein